MLPEIFGTPQPVIIPNMVIWTSFGAAVPITRLVAIIRGGRVVYRDSRDKIITIYCPWPSAGNSFLQARDQPDLLSPVKSRRIRSKVRHEADQTWLLLMLGGIVFLSLWLGLAAVFLVMLPARLNSGTF